MQTAGQGLGPLCPTSKYVPISREIEERIAENLGALYGSARVIELLPQVEAIIARHSVDPAVAPTQLSERDAFLIAYGNQVTSQCASPLQTLGHLLTEELSDLISGIHILPFFPYSSDDGFSVIDYRQVNSDLGTWDDIQRIGSHTRLMIDAVVNHVSAQSEWFQAFLRGNPEYQDTFITVDPSVDLSSVIRPRDLPLLTHFDTAVGPRYVWTTFSADQIDLNYANPEVLLEILDLLLFYVGNGAQVIRLDAIAFLWKQVGTQSIHLPQTHHAVKLMRAVLDAAAPGVLLITETNVPHDENISYFGEGNDEANLVYQFALPPLVLHTMTSGNSMRLAQWVSGLSLPSDDVTFFNFLASHDGIGLRPVADLLSEEELQALVALPDLSGGAVSYRTLEDGGKAPYELNVTYLDALMRTSGRSEDTQRAADRFLAAHAIMLAMPGLPGIYFHSLFGSRNDLEEIRRTGNVRSINREKLELLSLREELADRSSLRHQIFEGLVRLLRARASHPAFSPWSKHRVIEAESAVFGLMREGPAGRRVLCVSEVAGTGLEIRIAPNGTMTSDLITGESVDPSRLWLAPYQVRWILQEEEWEIA
ncbi:MAG: sugar phosphorylase [Anaerolineales bacterium]